VTIQRATQKLLPKGSEPTVPRCTALGSRLLRVVFSLTCLSLPLAGQSYQTSFAPQTFEKTKFTLALGHGGVSVDPATGGVNVDYPLGPGIGPSTMKFQPGIRGAIQPRVVTGNIPGYSGAAYAMPATSGLSVSPGTLDLNFQTTNIGRNWYLDPSCGITPLGEGFGFDVRKPNQVQAGWDITHLLSSFGYSTTIAETLLPAGLAQTNGNFGVISSTGGVVLGIKPAGTADPTINGNLWGAMYYKDASAAFPMSYGRTDGSPTVVPSQILYISGNILFEYTLQAGRFAGGPCVTIPGNSIDPTVKVYQNMYMTGAHYRCTAMQDRFGNVIKFTYGSDGMTYSARWFKNGTDTLVHIDQGDLSVTYYSADGTQPFSFSIAYNPSLSPWYWAAQPKDIFTSWVWSDIYAPATLDKTTSILPGSITNTASNETVNFNYTSFDVSSIVGNSNPNGTGLAVLQSVTFPGAGGGTLNFQYAAGPQPYRRNLSSSGTWAGYNGPVGSVTDGAPEWMWCVTTTTNPDPIQNRAVSYTRALPNPDFTTPNGWIGAPQFWVITTHEDGSSTLQKYLSPLSTPGGPSESLANQLQTLGHLKHVISEIREYEPGVNASADVSNPPDQSTAYQVTVFDRWDLREPGNPTGSIGSSSVPYPTRTRTWSDTGVYSEDELLNWDSVNAGWQTHRKLIAPRSLSSYLSYDMVGLALSGASSSPGVSGGSVIDLTETRTYDSCSDQWLWSRVTSEAKPGQPTVQKTYDCKNLLTSLKLGGTTLEIDTAFNYYQSGSSNGLLHTVTVTSPQALGNQGVGATYGYDSLGFMNSIQLNGSGWTVGQVNDSLGRPTLQTDANGVTTSIGYDPAGRLHTVTTQGEDGTTYDYDTDFKGVTISHGVQQSQVRYNSFGNVIAENRTADGANWSNKTYGYDIMGRKTWEWIWTTGKGSETMWAQPTQTGQIQVGNQPGTWTTDCRMFDQAGNCLKPLKIYEPGPAIYAPIQGTQWTYDGRGRMIGQLDTNGVVTSTSYSGLTKTVTLGTSPGLSTVFTDDVKGRLVQVVDPAAQVTTYSYDTGDRILTVNQYPSSTGTGASIAGAGTPQTRRWVYNSLGQTIALDQPESGVTYLTAFNVPGKATKAVYGLPRGWRPASTDTEDPSASSASGTRVVSTLYDLLGRVNSVVSTDGTVNEALTYDEGGAGAFANGKLTTAVTGTGVKRQLRYNGVGGLNGRLTDLIRIVDGQPPFAQSMTYNSNGTLKSRTYPDGKVQSISYDTYKMLPNATSFNGGTIVNLASYDPVTWNLNTISYRNNANSFFTYGADQARLAKLQHIVPAAGGLTISQSWGYQYDQYSRMWTDGEDTYGYDNLGRLTSSLVVDPFTYTSPSNRIQQIFSYDPFGNRTSLSTMIATVTQSTTDGSLQVTGATALPTDPRDLRSYTMNSSEVSSMAGTNHLPTTAGGVPTGVGVGAAGYDQTGNLLQFDRVPGTSGSMVHLGYDALGRVTTMTDDGRGVTEYYDYDDEGLRIKVESWQWGLLQNKTYNIYNELRQLVAQYQLVLK